MRSKRFPNRIAYLSTLPGEKCGISTYTSYLSSAVAEHYHTAIYRDLHSGVPSDSLIHSQVEFGVFPDPRLILGSDFADAVKVCTWHTILRNPFAHIVEYVQDVDREYDAHIVHTVLGKQWLLPYVTKPVHMIPHGALLWNPVSREEARAKLGIPKKTELAFCFGFAADSKGFGELMDGAKRVRRPYFKLVVSGAIHGVVKEETEKEVLRLKRMTHGKADILGQFLSEEDINLWASAADVLVFNYKTPSEISSASGAMKRILAAGKPMVCVDDNRLEELVAGQHCLKYVAGDMEDFAVAMETVLGDQEIAALLGNNCRQLAERLSWKNTAKRHLQLYGQLIDDCFGPNYYDEAYFDTGDKTYLTPQGDEKRWGYLSTSTVNWQGWEAVVDGLKEIGVQQLLDVGTGTGGLVHFARLAGVNAKGCDFSDYAVEHAFGLAKDFVDLADVRKGLPYKDEEYAWVTACDLLEHIRLEDLEKAIAEVRRVAKKYVFYNIGSAMQDSGQDFVLEKGKLPDKEHLVTTVAGHVTVKPCQWWRNFLRNDKWLLRDDLVRKFRDAVPPEVLSNWQCILIEERR
ncbi:MAG: methyltransferase domain-containing protein, partial [Candidatus Thermoplasmatota archaeon]|nr:methyltransferase domain-containing protein [Candidatus Thermoplasmatota archaeon]